MPTHEVLNQPPPFIDQNLFDRDPALGEALRREGAAWAEADTRAFGARMGSAEVTAWGFQANENPPVLKTHDRWGHRIDEVDFHPAWHSLMACSVEHGLHSAPFRTPKKDGAHVARAAMFILASQVENGHLCPMAMTYAVLPALRKQPDVAAVWEPRILSTKYDPRCRPASEKLGVLTGMAMTEKQGGSDVRANTTKAEPMGKGGPGGDYLLTGHKWFCSAPMCDAFLMLAHTQKGLTCFLLPRWTPEGKRNAFYIQRLKNKLGNKSNASSEIELDKAYAQMVGEEGRGVATIIEMANHTRLDCVTGSAGGIRLALTQAIHHARHRSAFGKLLSDQALMKNVLADMTVESEAATILGMRLARAYDHQGDEEFEAPFKRIATAISKYWVCKRTPTLVLEAMECLGGSGYVEESPLPRMYRETPVNSIWEGSGNVMCLDVLRAMNREPGTVEALFREIKAGVGQDKRLDAFVRGLEAERGDANVEVRARRLVERLALGLQGSLLVRFGDAKVAEAFCASRLGGDWGQAFGTLPREVDFDAILARAMPA
jgi:putative acyl-CoA dehydrogenase